MRRTQPLPFKSRAWLSTACAALMLALPACDAPSQKSSDDTAAFQTGMTVGPQVKPMHGPWQDDPRIDDLIAQMTLDEKLAQISCIWFDKKAVINADGSFNAEVMKEKFPHGVGCFARPQDTQGMEAEIERKGANDSTVIRSLTGRDAQNTAELTNAIQKWHIEETRLGIPTLFHEEGLHGFQAYQATSFPQSIALASTFDTDLIEDIYSVTAREIRARGAHHVLSPVVDVARDPRWGRIEETFGEDPYLVSQMGLAAIRGFQGTSDYLADDKVLTTLKHMTGHGQPESGTNVAPANISERVLREIFFPPFEAAVIEGKAASVMASYNEIDGIPSHANAWLLGGVLRGEWGFNGAVVADYFAINELQGRHSVAANIGDAGLLALKAGVDLELPDGVAYYALKERIESGEVDMELIYTALRRVLEMKVRGRVFETPFVDASIANAATGNDEARALAEDAARKAIILLKNEGKLLPLDASAYKRIAVIGPNAAITVLGGYADEPRQTVSILDGIRVKLGDDVDVVHAQGVTLTDNRSWWDDNVNLIDPAQNARDIKAAVAVAQSADLVILAVGGDESTSREAWSETHMGDRSDIGLIGQQDDLIKAIAETGKPVVTVLISGRPLAITDVEPLMPAILNGWILGQETGTAVADVLFGDYNPGGKMPVSVPRSVGHIPAYYNHKPTARRGYAFGDGSALYPFGFGLSYTDFEISEPSLTPKGGANVDVSVTVTNSGSVAGDEVVQVYVRDLVSSVTRNVKDLKAFKRVTLEPGASETVTLSLGPKAFEMYDLSMNRVVEPGDFEIMVGNSSDSTQSAIFTVE